MILRSVHPKFDPFLEVVDEFGKQVTQDTPMLLRRDVDKAIQEALNMRDGDGKLWKKSGRGCLVSCVS